MMTSSKLPKKIFRGAHALITVDRKAPKALYQQIYAGFLGAIIRGDFRGGQPVPSTRELAHELRISRLPVLNAYSQLLAEGHFESRRGSGTFIAAKIPAQPASHRQPRAKASTRKRTVSLRAAALPQFETPYWNEDLGAFQVGQPELKSFPVHIWSRLLSRYSRELKVKALQYGHPLGLEELRQVLAMYLRTARGVRCEADQVMIVTGSQQALDLATRVLLDPGAPVWVEEPGVLACSSCLEGWRLQGNTRSCRLGRVECKCWNQVATRRPRGVCRPIASVPAWSDNERDAQISAP